MEKTKKEIKFSLRQGLVPLPARQAPRRERTMKNTAEGKYGEVLDIINEALMTIFLQTDCMLHKENLSEVGQERLKKIKTQLQSVSEAAREE